MPMNTTSTEWCVSKSKREKNPETTGEMIRSFVIAILIALVFRSVAYEPFHIPSGSMLNTLYKGDYIFVSKLSYGYSRYSFPFGIEWFEGRKFRTAPERGDIIVFRLPRDPRVDYIKRLIGLPGDTVQVKNGLLYINGEPVEVNPQEYIEVPKDSGGMQSAELLRETLPNGVTHNILNSYDGGVVDTTPEYTVPDGHYFFMGDNRDNSMDSRYMKEVGFVPEENLVGRAEIILVSFKGGVPVWQVWNWWKALRNDRWFTDLTN